MKTKFSAYFLIFLISSSPAAAENLLSDLDRDAGKLVEQIKATLLSDKFAGAMSSQLKRDLSFLAGTVLDKDTARKIKAIDFQQTWHDWTRNLSVQELDKGSFSKLSALSTNLLPTQDLIAKAVPNLNQAGFAQTSKSFFTTIVADIKSKKNLRLDTNSIVERF
ncbi:hypothetical protein JNK13_07595 [bacterium]|nr:hypothetical protein [bacterium]